jgi:DNA primase
MRFLPAFLDEIRGRVPISSVVGRSVQWERRKSNPAKGDFWANCPFHKEKTPSFHADDRKGRYYCFGCQASGDIFKFLVEKDGLSFAEAVERLAQEAGLPMPHVSQADELREQTRASLFDVMEMATVFFEAQLQAARGAGARGYLADRGVPSSAQQQFRLGYAPDERYALKAHLADKAVSLEQMASAGLILTGDDIPVAFDRFRDRVMFPIRDPRGRVVAFGGRALSSEAPAKYLNSPDTPLFQKGAVLYNFDLARGPAFDSGTLIAVEGYMDVLAMTRAGFPNTVAPLGTALTEEQLALLWRAAPDPVLCFDGDQAGQKALHRALDMALPSLSPGRSLRFALLPAGQDPDDLLRNEGAEAIRAVIEEARPMSDVLWVRALDANDRSTPEKRAQFERDLITELNRIEDAKVRQHYLAEMGARLARLWSSSPQRGDQWPGRFGHRRFAPRPVVNRKSGHRTYFQPHDYVLPPRATLKAIAAGGLSSAARREAAILLAIINHPSLLEEFSESFAELEFSRRELDRMRREIIDIAALEASLDAATLRDHLERKGFGPLLRQIDAQFQRLEEWFVRPDAAAEDVRTGFRQMVELHRKVALDRELKLAETQLAENPSDENLRKLNGILEQRASGRGEEAQIERFGEASGRPQEPVA